MSAFDIDVQGQRDMADIPMADPDDIPATAFQGLLKGPAMAFEQSIARGGRAVVLAAAGASRLLDRIGGIDSSYDDETAFSALDKSVNPVIQYWTPGPNEIGTAGRLLAIPASIGGDLAAGGPLGMIANEGLNAGADIIDSGGSADTATQIALLRAGMTAAGLKVPMIGSNLRQRLVAGVAGNVAIGSWGRDAEQDIMRVGGMPEGPGAADPASVGLDTLAGLMFGGLHHVMTPSERAATSTLANAKNFMSDSAPGEPAGPVDSALHQQAMTTALEQVTAGQPVNVDPRVADATFSGDRINALLERMPRAPEAAAAEELPPAIPFVKGLDADQRAVEARFRPKIQAEFDALVDEYQRRFGDFINTDKARELSPDYEADRTANSGAVHEVASAVAKAAFARALAKPVKADEPPVIFTAGGTGAGKTTGMGAIEPGQIVFDTNMNNLESATKKIDQVLASGRKVLLNYVYRDPVEALINGALARAKNPESESFGRSLKLGVHAETHVGASRVMRELAEHYKDNQDVEIRVIDNSHGRGNAKPSSLADIPVLEQNKVESSLKSALDKEFSEGRIDKKLYDAFNEEPRNGSENDRRAGPASNAGVSGEPAEVPGQPEQGGQGKRSSAGSGSQEEGGLDRESAALQQQADAAVESLRQTNPDIFKQVIEFDGQKMTVEDLLALTKREADESGRFAKAYQAAAQCFLGNGA